MGWISKILGGGAGKIVGTIADTVDQFVETPDEKRAVKLAFEKIAANEAIAQAAINQIEAAHPNWFVAGWRPFIGWICGLGVAMEYLLGPIIGWIAYLSGRAADPPEIVVAELMVLLGGMLGLSGMRTFERKGGVARS